MQNISFEEEEQKDFKRNRVNSHLFILNIILLLPKIAGSVVDLQAMNQTVKMNRMIRVRGLVVALVCLSILVTAICLTPRERGYGTHQSLGMATCGFKARHGYPCPTCGMTTSVAATVRLDIPLAWKSHPFGLIFTVFVIGGFLAGTVELYSGKNLLSKPCGIEWKWVIIAVVLLLVAGWGVKVLSGILDGRFPDSR